MIFTASPGTAAAPHVSRGDDFRFNALQTLPQFLRGTFTRRPRVGAMLDRVLSDPLGVRLVSDLRRKYGSDYLWLSMLGKPSLLVLDVNGIRQVLDSSPAVYGPPDLKVRGMSHFQPDALTISTGADWTRRRAFSDEVLGAGRAVHPRAAEFLGAVDSAISPLVAGERPTLRGTDIHAAFRRLTSHVVFGPAIEAEPVLSRLDALMKRANRIGGKSDTPERRALHDGVRERILDPRAAGLAAAACPHIRSGGARGGAESDARGVRPDEAVDSLPVAGQVTHWLFAMKDTLAANCANALALIAAHPEVQERAHSESAATDLGDPAAVDRMAYVEGCLRDTMRLWPTTPLILRKALRDTDLAGHAVPAGSQVVIHNGFNHRNPEAIVEPDRFHPDAWQQGVWDYRFNYLSNGPQACGGRELVLFLGKAALANCLRRHRWTLTKSSVALGPRLPGAQAFDARAMVLTGRA